MKSIQWYKSLSLSKERRLCGCFLIEGKKAIDQLFTYHRSAISELLCTEETALLYADSGIAVRIFTAQNMKSICTSKTPQGVAAVVKIPQGVYTSDIPPQKGNIVLLEGVQDPGNAGSLIRTAAALGYSGVIMSDKCADPFSPKAVQSTAGSLLSVWIRRSGDYLEMVSQLKNDGRKLICADLSGDESLNFKENAESHMLALGSEGAGISEDLLKMSDYTVRVPITERGAESLNVGAAGAILMFMCSRSPALRQGLRTKE